MESEKRPTYKIGDVEIDLANGTVRRGATEVHLRHKTFTVLAYLLENRGRDLSKNDIIRDVWLDTAVVDDVLVQSVTDIRRALGDDTKQPRFIRTIPKVGYRFIGEPDAEAHQTSVQHSPGSYQGKRTRLILLVGAIISIFALTATFVIPRVWNDSSEALTSRTAGKKTVIVMFFDNQTRDEDLNWLREGLADMLIAGISRSPNLTVVSRVQLHTLIDRNSLDSTSLPLPKALEVARRSGSEVLIAGSFSRLGEKLRIDAQGYDTATGNLLASETLKADKPDLILTEIDLISLKLARRLGGTQNEEQRGVAGSMTKDLGAYRYYSLAVEKAHALHSDEAVQLLERAIALDPEFAMAHARIGYTYAVAEGNAEKGKAPLERAFQLSDRLTHLDRLNISAWYAIANLDYPAAIVSLQEIIAKYPLETEAYWRSGRLLLGEERYDDAVNVLQQGLLVDPDDKDIYNALSVTYRDSHRHQEAVEMAKRYLLLAPNEPNAFDTLALALQARGDFQQAEEQYRKALEIQPNFDVAILHLANLKFQTGLYSEAIRLYELYSELVRSNGDKAWAHGRIAWVNWRLGNKRSALLALEKEQKLDPNAFSIALLIAIERRDKASIARLRQRLDAQSKGSERGLRPSKRLEAVIRGKLALFVGDRSAALRYFNSALKHRPLVWDIAAHEDALADALVQLEEYADAAIEYERILTINPNYPFATFKLAQVAEKTGDRAKAAENYRRFTESWKEADTAIPEIVEAKKFLSAYKAP